MANIEQTKEKKLRYSPVFAASTLRVSLAVARYRLTFHPSFHPFLHSVGSRVALTKLTF